MADEPTWDDLFGEPLTPQRQTRRSTPPVQLPRSPSSRPRSSQPVAVRRPRRRRRAAACSRPSAPTSAPLQPPYLSAQPPADATRRRPRHQPTYAAAPQPTYVSQLPPAPTPPHAAAGQTSRRGAADDRRRGGRVGAALVGRLPAREAQAKAHLAVGAHRARSCSAAAGAGVVYAAFGPQIRHVMGWEPSIDYTRRPATVSRRRSPSFPARSARMSPTSLAKAGVTKTSTAFYDLLLKQKKAPNFEPGTYKLRQADEREGGARRDQRPGEPRRVQGRHPRGLQRRPDPGAPEPEDRRHRSATSRPRPRTTRSSACPPAPRASRASCSRRPTQFDPEHDRARSSCRPWSRG